MVDLDRLPIYELHTMYYMLWREKEEESKMTDDQKAGKAIGNVLQDAL
jgi:hypothetical protein